MDARRFTMLGSLYFCIITQILLLLQANLSEIYQGNLYLIIMATFILIQKGDRRVLDFVFFCCHNFFLSVAESTHLNFE
jgi:hypothetical protein